MKLMFWKKKSAAEGEAEALAENAKPRESLDFVAPGQSSAGQNPEPTGADEASLEPPAKPRLAERMKSLLVGLTGYFRRTPAFHAEVEPEVPEEEYQEGGPVRSRKRLIIGGAIAAAVLLLVVIGVALWPSSEQPPQKQSAPHDMTAAPGASQPAAAPQAPPNEIEALRKENAELQAKIEALKKGQPQPRPAAQATGASAPSSSSVGGEMAVDTQDPKAAAMMLKQAIEEMNASSGDYRKKPAK